MRYKIERLTRRHGNLCHTSFSDSLDAAIQTAKDDAADPLCVAYCEVSEQAGGPVLFSTKAAN